MKTYTLRQTEEILSNFADKSGLKNREILRWIILNTLCVPNSKYNEIKDVKPEEIRFMQKVVLKYIGGQSLGDIFGFVQFYDRFFDVNEDVFDPRMSTEALVSSVLKTNKEKLKNAKIIDLCTGSGCVAITLADELDKEIDAVDISPDALTVAKKNSNNYKTKVNFYQFDLNDDWGKLKKEKYDIIVSNPPYWDIEKIMKNPEVINGNPLYAFNGGKGGMKYISIIIKNAQKYLKKGGLVFMEADSAQIELIKKMMKQEGYKVNGVAKDHRGLDRVIEAEVE